MRPFNAHSSIQLLKYVFYFTNYEVILILRVNKTISNISKGGLMLFLYGNDEQSVLFLNLYLKMFVGVKKY